MKAVVLFLTLCAYGQRSTLSTPTQFHEHEANNENGTWRMQYIQEKLERNSTSKIQSILNRLTEGEFIKYATNNIVLVLGNTGAGKSTFVQYIAGNNSNLISQAVYSSRGRSTGDYTIVDTNNKIGRSVINSHTELPELVFDIKTNTAIYDCPGFSDTRDAEHDISGTYFIKKITDHAKAIKLVFIVNYSSVKSGIDKADFMLLAKHATTMIKNINKFKDGIAIVATKVNDDKPYDQIINTIVAFLEEVKDELNNAQPQQSLLKQNIIQFVDILLTTNDINSQDYPRIGFLKQPKQPGPLSAITEIQNHKKSLEKLLYENIKYIQYNSKDFGYTISADSQNYIHGLVEAINNNIVSIIENISRTVQIYYKDLVRHMRDKIHSFVNSRIAVDANLSQAQSFSAQLNNGHSTISKLSAEMQSINSTEDLAKKINDSMHDLNINISQNVISDILTQGQYLEFLSSVRNNSTESLKPLELEYPLQDALKTLSESKSFILVDVRAVGNQIKSKIESNIKKIGTEIQQYFYGKEAKVHDIQKLYDELYQGYDSLSKTRESANKLDTPENCVQQIRDGFNNLNITSDYIASAKHTLSNTINHCVYLSFCEKIIVHSLTNSFKCADGLEGVIEYLDHSQKWYQFLLNLHGKLTSYQIQKNTSSYGTTDLGVPGDKNKKVSETSLKSFLKKIYQQKYHLEYNNIKGITLDEPKLNALNSILDFTLNHEVDKSCSDFNTKLVIKGHYVKLSDIDNSECSTATSIKIYALSTAFIDTDLDRTGKRVELSIIAPTWDIQGTRKIVLDGEPGKGHDPPTAKDGSGAGSIGTDGKPGLPGGPGGNFLGIGIGDNFINAKLLTIFANGGKGGRGQNGGNGANGKDGKKVSLPPKNREGKSYSLGDPLFLRSDESLFWENNPDFIIDNKAEKPKQILSQTHVLSAISRMKICGQHCTNGGNGGNGGIGGFGGNPGRVIIVDLLNKHNNVISSTNEVGNFGENGFGGHGGNSGENYQCMDVEIAIISTGYLEMRRYVVNKHYNLACSSGQSGVNNNGNNNKPELMQFKHIPNIINDYKSYLRENLSDSIIASSLRKFLSLLESPNAQDLHKGSYN